MMRGNQMISLIVLQLLLYLVVGHALPASAKPQAVHVLPLRSGPMLIRGTDHQVIVATRFGKVICAPHVTVYIFDNGRGVVVYDLDSLGGDDVKVEVNKKFFRLKPGAELAISNDSTAKFDDLQPVLNILHKQPKPLEIGAGYLGYATEFSIVEAVKNIRLLKALAASDRPEDKQLLRRILHNAAILQPTSLGLPETKTREALAFKSPVDILDQSTQTKILQGKVEYFDKGKARAIDMRLSNSRNQALAEISGLNWLECKNGEWKNLDIKNSQPDYLPEVAGLITCPVDTTVKTELCDIDCKKGVAAFIVDHGDSVAVCTLESPGIANVIVHFGNRFVRLAPGREIVFTKQLETPIEHVSPIHLIGHRNTRELGVFDGMKVIATDFSLPAAMIAIEPLRKMVSSADSEQRKLARAIVKNSVILSGLTIHDGLFHAPKQQ